MALTEERIKELMSKDIKSKTMMVSKEDLEKVKKEYLDDGWKIYKETSINDRIKITFQKIK